MDQPTKAIEKELDDLDKELIDLADRLAVPYAGIDQDDFVHWCKHYYDRGFQEGLAFPWEEA